MVVLSFNQFFLGVDIGLIVTVLATAYAYYINFYLLERRRYKVFREEFDHLFEANAEVNIPLANVGKVKILEVKRAGLVVENQEFRTFIPIELILRTQISSAKNTT